MCSLLAWKQLAQRPSWHSLSHGGVVGRTRTVLPPCQCLGTLLFWGWRVTFGALPPIGNDFFAGGGPKMHLPTIPPGGTARAEPSGVYGRVGAEAGCLLWAYCWHLSIYYLASFPSTSM